MPHYKDGTEAQLGDVVKGRGYNVKGPDGKLAELVGTVVAIEPGSDTCNVEIAYHTVARLPDDFQFADHRFFEQKRDVKILTRGGRSSTVTSSIEYGQADHFELVHRPPPADPPRAA